VGDQADVPSRFATRVSAESAERCSRVAGNVTKGDWVLRRSSTFEHTAGIFTREIISAIKVTG